MPRRFDPAVWIPRLLVVATLAAFWPVYTSGFVNYDDDVYVTDNPDLRAGLTPHGLGWAFTTLRASNWHPLTWISLLADYQVYGLLKHPGGWHLTNVVLHALNAVLLFLVLRRMTGAVWPSALVAALFALHPLHVESVAWVSERKDVLSTFFGLLALLAYARYAERPGWRPYLLVVLAFALSLLAKPMLVTLPFLLLLLDYWPLRRFAWGKPFLEKVPLFALAAGFCVVTWYAQQHGKAIQSLEHFPFWARAGNALVAYTAYVGKAVWPVGLSIFYPHPGTAVGWRAPAAAGVLLAITTGLVVAYRRRFPYVFVGWLWYLGTLVPVIGLVQVGHQAMADRYTYFPLVGLFVAASWALAALAKRRDCRPAVAWSASAAVVVCAVLTTIQAGYWHDSVTLWEHALDVNPANALAHYNLGVLANRTPGKHDEAVDHFAKAVKFDPNNLEAHNNLGVLLLDRGDVPRAERHLRRALEIDGGNALANANLARVLMRQDRWEEAATHARRALEADPRNGEAHNVLGAALLSLGETAEAEQHFRAAIGINARSAAAHYNLGRALARQGKPREALASFQAAVDLNGNVVLFVCGLASALNQVGRREEAQAQYARAFRLDRNWPYAADREAWRLATRPRAKKPQGRDAVEAARQACEATGNKNARFLDTLAAAYARAGDWDQAVATAGLAMTGTHDAGLAERVSRRRDLYWKHQPFDDPGGTGQH